MHNFIMQLHNKNLTSKEKNFNIAKQTLSRVLYTKPWAIMKLVGVQVI